MKNNFYKHKKQDGLVLVVVLVMVPVIFMLSYTSINKLTVGERATTNVVDRGHAFYAAEMAIADAEAWMNSKQDPFVDGFTEEKFNLSAAVHKGLYPIGADININSVLIHSESPGAFGYGYYEENIEVPEPPAQPQGMIQQVPESDELVLTKIMSTLSDKPAYIIQLVNVSECVSGATHNRALMRVVSRGWGVQGNTMVTLENFFSLRFLCENQDGSLNQGGGG